jgi:transposase
MHYRGVEEIRRRFVEEGFEETLKGKPCGHRPRSIDGEDEARLIKLACEEKPDGIDHWSLRYLSEKLVTIEGGHVSHETIRRVLKKMKPNRGKEKNGAYRRKETQNS